MDSRKSPLFSMFNVDSYEYVFFFLLKVNKIVYLWFIYSYSTTVFLMSATEMGHNPPVTRIL